MPETSDFLILGTDTGAGKTTLAMLWLAGLGEGFEYWKPIETGDSDSQQVDRCVPQAQVHAPLMQLAEPVAPLLAARKAGSRIPLAAEIAAARPEVRVPGRRLVVETFGGPFSSLNDTELQLALIQTLNLPTILVCSSAVGAIGRALQGLHALERYEIVPAAVVLMGPTDAFAVEQIARHWTQGGVFSLQQPSAWDAEGIARAAREQLDVLEAIDARLQEVRRGGAVSAQPCKSPFIPASDILQRDRQSVWHPYTSMRPADPPLVSVGAEAEFLDLGDGRRVIDGISSWWTILYGHRYPPLMAALAAAAKVLDHVQFAGVTHEPAVALAELLLSTAPWPGGRVFYSDNGSTAVEVALKMAYQYWCHQDQPERTCFVGLEGGYHGDTFGAMSVGRDPLFFGRFEPLLFQAEMVPIDADRLDEVLRRRAGHVAAVIVEPLVQGASGMRMYTPETLAALAAVAREHDVLLIADEVMTGGGRTGWLWAHQAAGIAPDLICASKTLAGGLLPLAATLAAPKLVAAWDTADASRTFFHGHSFTAHPLACAVALANWRMLLDVPPQGDSPIFASLRGMAHAKIGTVPAVPAAPGRMEAFWNQSLGPLRARPHVRDVRVRGSIAAVELDVPGGYLSDVGRTLRRVCLEHGVLLRPLGSVLYTMPPFCTSPESLQRIARAIAQAVEAVAP